MHPTLASLQDLPDAILFIIPTIDFLLYEQLDMFERLEKESSQEEKRTTSSLSLRKFEKLIFEGQLHGWLECASSYCRMNPGSPQLTEQYSTLLGH